MRSVVLTRFPVSSARVRIGFLVLAAAIVGCGPRTAKYTDILQEIEGTYAGSYTINHDYGTPEERVERGTVRVSFRNGIYDMTPATRNLPPAARGKYHLDQGKINLVNTSMHTGDFDWTLILRGHFDYEMTGDVLTLIQVDRERNRLHTMVLTRQSK